MITKKDNLSLIIFLIPLSLIFGIAVTEVLVLSCILVFLINQRDKLILYNYQIIFLISFSLYICLNSILQIQGEYSENLKLSSLLHFRFVFCIICCLFM